MSEARGEHSDTGQHGSERPRGQPTGQPAGNGADQTERDDAVIEAIRFLQAFDPAGRHNLVAFDPHSGRPVDGRCF